MNKYFYCPILKTRQAEVNAYDMLDVSLKDVILPIIEMTGELGYTYPKNYKVENLRGLHRSGDINKKISKILNLVGGRKFILDITDDESLMFDGLKENGGLLDNNDGYKKWINFLTSDEIFKNLVIPTIQFNTLYKDDVRKQIEKLNNLFPYVAIKLPVFLTDNSEVKFNFNIVKILEWVSSFFNSDKLFVILDFGYIRDFNIYLSVLNKKFEAMNECPFSTKIKAIIPVSSSFPASITSIGKQEHMKIFENIVADYVRKKLLNFTVINGDYSSLYPTKYEMRAGGWIPRIDYVVKDDKNCPVEYKYIRGSSRNNSSEYFVLSRQVINSKDYIPSYIGDNISEGDARIKNKSEGGQEGNSPSYWIAVRSNLYLTAQILYLKKEDVPFLSL